MSLINPFVNSQIPGLPSAPSSMPNSERPTFEQDDFQQQMLQAQRNLNGFPNQFDPLSNFNVEQNNPAQGFEGGAGGIDPNLFGNDTSSDFGSSDRLTSLTFNTIKSQMAKVYQKIWEQKQLEAQQSAPKPV